MLPKNLFMYQKSILLLVIGTLIDVGNSTNMKIVGNKLEIDTNPTYGTATGQIRTDDNSDYLIDLEFNLIKDMGNNMYVQRILKSKIDDKYLELHTDSQINYCEFIKNPAAEKIMKWFYDELEKYGNFIRDCPIDKGNYYIKGFKVEFDSLPMVIPVGEYCVEFHVTTMINGTQEKVWTIFNYFTVEQDN